MLLAAPFAFLAALIPTLVYVYLIWWCDRYEREPGWLLLMAFLWGAIPAILLSLAAELLLGNAYGAFALGMQESLRRVVLISPVVEEVAKALALLAIVFFFAQEIDDVLDGIIYGALVGIGFAMTENFFFLNSAAQDGMQNLLSVALVRTLLFGLNHAYYTAITGAAIGVAIWQPRRRDRWPLILGGLGVAILVHALHNLSTVLAPYNPLLSVFSVLLNWGGVFLFVAIISLALRQERDRMRVFLANEIPHAISQHNYDYLQECDLRWGWLKARLAGKDARQARLEAELQRAAAELAARKRRQERMIGDDRLAMHDEIEVLRQRLRTLDQALGQAVC